MGAFEGDVVRWIGCAKKEKSRGYHRGVLTVLISPMESHALDARVIGNVLLLLKNLTSLKLPPSRCLSVSTNGIKTPPLCFGKSRLFLVEQQQCRMKAAVFHR